MSALPESVFEKKMNDFLRRGDIGKAKVLQSLGKRIMPTQIQRIRKNDKSVLQEIVLPRWLSWELLKLWADESTAEETGKLCALCSNFKETGIKFRGKFICEACYREVKGIPPSSGP